MKVKLKQILKYSGSVYLGQILNILSIFIIPKFLEPVMLGKFNLLQMIYNYSGYTHLGMAFGLNKELPLHLGKKNFSEAEDVASAGMTGILIATILIDIVVLLSIFLFSSQFDKDIFYGIPIVIIAMLFCLITVILKIIVRAYEEIPKMTKITVIYSTIWSLFKIIGVIVYGFYGLLLSMLISNIVSAVIVYIIANKKLYFNFNLPKMFSLLKTGFPYLIYNFLSILFMSLDKWIIIIFLGFKQLGYYSIASMSVGILITLPSSVNEVLFPNLLKKISAKKDKTIILNYLKKYISISSKVFTLIIGSFIIFIGFIITYFLPQYIPGILPTQILILSVYPTAFQNLFVYYLYGINKNRLFLFSNIFGFIIWGIGITFLYFQMSVNLVSIAILMVISTFIYSYMIIYFTLNELQINKKDLIIIMFKSIIPLYAIILVFILLNLFTYTETNIIKDFIMTNIYEIIFIILSIPIILNLKNAYTKV